MYAEQFQPHHSFFQADQHDAAKCVPGALSVATCCFHVRSMLLHVAVMCAPCCSTLLSFALHVAAVRKQHTN
eukprot:scaffold95907_cov18-Tisochrysis_lutea.AAC.1